MTEQIDEDHVLDLKNVNPYLSYILDARNNTIKWMKHLYVVGLQFISSQVIYMSTIAHLSH